MTITITTVSHGFPGSPVSWPWDLLPVHEWLIERAGVVATGTGMTLLRAAEIVHRMHQNWTTRVWPRGGGQPGAEMRVDEATAQALIDDAQRVVDAVRAALVHLDTHTVHEADRWLSIAHRWASHSTMRG
ncbi:hypothetical protein L6E12_31455 [Actinokineospora sp. PR83]|uniref:hypothetical protein n=1 Tax=Actinokineospora sp. PR83 TaxID=2884908 RepID=UPI001F364914|nr:hypothetical protein [Actinokineospora sp. PR83]MCG8920296.1 hypothetical protein [Actinokineospora sp. PR83]